MSSWQNNSTVNILSPSEISGFRKNNYPLIVKVMNARP